MWHGGQGLARYLGGSHHRRCGCHIQASLPEVHQGVVTPVLCLDKAIIDFLSKENRDTLSGRVQRISVLSPFSWGLGLAPCPVTIPPGLKSRAPWVCVRVNRRGEGERQRRCRGMKRGILEHSHSLTDPATHGHALSHGRTLGGRE